MNFSVKVYKFSFFFLYNYTLFRQNFIYYRKDAMSRQKAWPR